MIKILYHQVKPGIDCPDGLAAAWVAHLKYPDAEITGCTYQSEELPKVEQGDRLIIVDFSFPANVMQAWADAGADVTVIDHHKTAMDNLQGLSDRILARFDMNECGATLTWKTLFPDERMPAFLEYVRDRDLWNHALPMTAEIHEATAALKRSFALYDVLSLMYRDELIRFLAPLGEKLLKPKREKIEKIARRFEWRLLPAQSGFNTAVPVVVLAKDGSEDRLVSDVCSKLYKDMPQAVFVACIASDGSWSLRSDKDGSSFDVSEIAKAMGGGGHRNAAGFR